MRIGIIGCGVIAREISKIHKISYSYDIFPEKCSDLGEVCNDVDSLISKSDLVIEAASPQAVQEYARKIVSSGKDFLIMSVGGLADEEFRDEIFQLAKENGSKIYLPSGAIGGMDLIRAARIAGLDEVKIRSTKNPRALGVECKERTLIFSGNAKEAIKRFPRSTNVTVLLSIVSGMDVKVEVFADPNTTRNVHEIYLRGKFGEATIEIKNNPSEENPRTSYLAALSPISVLELIDSSVIAGV